MRLTSLLVHYKTEYIILIVFIIAHGELQARLVDQLVQIVKTY